MVENLRQCQRKETRFYPVSIEGNTQNTHKQDTRVDTHKKYPERTGHR